MVPSCGCKPQTQRILHNTAHGPALAGIDFSVAAQSKEGLFSLLPFQLERAGIERLSGDDYRAGAKKRELLSVRIELMRRFD